MTFAESVAARGQESGVPADWLRITPGDAGLYVEIRDLSAIREQFRQLGIWETVRDMGRGPTASGAQPWPHRAERTLGIDPDSAISDVLGHRAALIAASPLHWQDGIIVAELPPSADLPGLLRTWRARPAQSAGAVRCYELPDGILAGVRDRTLILGSRTHPPNRIWNAAVSLLSGQSGATLAGRSDVASLRARLTGDHSVFLCAAWPDEALSAQGRANRVVAGINVSATELTCDVRGLLANPVPAGPGGNVAVPTLPTTTLASWTGLVDFGRLAAQADPAEPDSPMPSFVWLFLTVFRTFSPDSQDHLPELGPQVSLVLDRGDANAVGLTVPSIGILCSAKGFAGVADHMNFVATTFLQAFVATAAESDEVRKAAGVRSERHDGVDVRTVRLGPLLGARSACPFFRELEVCWCIVDDTLVLTSSTRHARRIVTALRQKSADADADEGASGERERRAIVDLVQVRGAELSRQIAGWLDYLRRDRPECLDAAWWRRWASQRLERRSQLGVTLRDGPSLDGGAVVVDVSPLSPAHSRLQPGDVITAVDGTATATTRPARDVAERYRARANATEFRLRVRRGDATVEVVIPAVPAPAFDLTAFDPVGALRQIEILLTRVDRLTIRRYAARPEWLDADLSIRWTLPPRSIPVAPR